MNFLLDFLPICINVIIAYFAYKALMQSIRARRYSTFDAIFTQLISMQSSIFRNPNILKTELDVNCIDIINSNIGSSCKNTIGVCFENIQYRYTIVQSLPLMLSFVKYYQGLHRYCNKVFTVQQISLIWSSFTNNMLHKESFNMCFKYIYNMIITIENSNLTSAEKISYIERTQALFDRNELFCYFINLVFFYKNENSKYLQNLKYYEFFKDLFRDEEYRMLIKRTIPLNIISNLIDLKRLK